MSSLLRSYFDESATDGGSPIAVIGGIMLQSDAYTWLDIAWQKAIVKHSVEPLIHMKDFGQHGRLRDFPIASRQSLFTDLVNIINEERTITVPATVSTKEYKHYFSKPDKLDLYSVCFVLLATAQGKHADSSGYEYNIPFLLDDGNDYKQAVERAHDFLVNNFQKSHPLHCGTLAFGDDKNNSALQAADVVAWAVRRRSAGDRFTHGYEPLLGIFEGKSHLEQAFEPDWMAEISALL